MKNKKEKSDFFHIIKKNFKLQIVVCVTLSLMIIGIYFLLDYVIYEPVDYIISNEVKLINQVEQVYVEDNTINITGYAFLQDMDAYNTKISIMLKNTNDGKEIWADTEQTSRMDVNTYYNSDYNYINSGFKALIKGKKLNADDCYEIIVKLDNNSNIYVKDQNVEENVSKAVLSDRYIVNGELYFYNPYDFEMPDTNVESDLLREVFSNGRLCFYQKDIGMYVYQYNGQLYWIANENFAFGDNNITHIPYYVYTAKIDMLPDNGTQFKFDNLVFNFEEYEYSDEKTDPYRVAIRDIPDDYPISYIYTGVYDFSIEKMLWHRYINMNPVFEWDNKRPLN